MNIKDQLPWIRQVLEVLTMHLGSNTVDQLGARKLVHIQVGKQSAEEKSYKCQHIYKIHVYQGDHHLIVNIINLKGAIAEYWMHRDQEMTLLHHQLSGRLVVKPFRNEVADLKKHMEQSN